MDTKIQELIYLGTWMYSLADKIAYQKMIEECYQLSFDEDGLLVIDWQHHYGAAYNQLMPLISEEYKSGVFDEEAFNELRTKINNCFGIEYEVASGIIYEIQKHHKPKRPDLQTIEPYVLPINLAQGYNISQDIVDIFYSGLTISRGNKLSVKDAILKPHSLKRYMFRPILLYKVGDTDRALVGMQKFAESMMVLSTNAIHWNAMFEEWLQLDCIQEFINKKGDEHDKILEDKIEGIVKNKGFWYCRNIKSFKQMDKKNNVKINNKDVGEIDLIVIKANERKVYVAESKYNRARYEAVGFRMDYSQFINTSRPNKSYETKLRRKADWISNNLSILEEHLNVVYQKADINLAGYEVEAIFIINTPTFYMFNGNFKAITLKQFEAFIDGKYEYPDVIVMDSDSEIGKVSHPYFRKP